MRDTLPMPIATLTPAGRAAKSTEATEAASAARSIMTVARPGRAAVAPAAARVRRAPPVASPGLRLGRPLLAALVGLSLLAGVAGGLLRAGAADLLSLGPWLPQAAAVHAALMLSAGLGTLITVERAVAVRRRWAFLAPLAAGGSGLLLMAGQAGLAGLSGVLAAAVLTAVQLVVLRRQRAAHTVLLLVAALAWLVGQALFAAGAGLAALLPWWFAWPVLTIAAERLEMTRLTRRRARAAPLLLPVVALLLAGAVLSSFGVPLPIGIYTSCGANGEVQRTSWTNAAICSGE